MGKRKDARQKKRDARIKKRKDERAARISRSVDKSGNARRERVKKHVQTVKPGEKIINTGKELIKGATPGGKALMIAAAGVGAGVLLLLILK